MSSLHVCLLNFLCLETAKKYESLLKENFWEMCTFLNVWRRWQFNTEHGMNESAKCDQIKHKCGQKPRFPNETVKTSVNASAISSCVWSPDTNMSQNHRSSVNKKMTISLVFYFIRHMTDHYMILALKIGATRQI